MAEKSYFETEFRAHMRGMQGFTDEDFEKVAPIITRMVIELKEKDSFDMFERILKELVVEWMKPTFPVHAD